jgi:hypothetical protein
MAENFKCIVPSWGKIESIAKKVSEKIKKEKFRPDVVIGVARGGVVPARLLCDFLHIKDFLSLKAEHWGITATKNGKASIKYGLNIDLTGKNVLLVDDVTDTGESIELSKEHVKRLNPKTIKTATLYHLKGSKYVPDFFGLEHEWVWIIFPWNYREDLVNLIRKIETHKNMELEEIRKELKARFGVDVENNELKDVIAHINYLEVHGL